MEHHTGTRKKKRLGRTLRITFGVIFFILGIVGSVLPVLQGWIFFLLSIAVLFPDHPRVIKTVRKADDKFPKLARALRKMGIGDEDDDDDENDRPAGDHQPEQSAEVGNR